MSIFSSINQCTFSGYVGGDSKFNFTKDGTAVCNFSLAIDGWNYSKKEKTTMWMRVGCFGKLAETCEKWISKGTKVAVMGRLDENKWVDQEGGSHQSYQLVANEVFILEKSKSDPRNSAATSPGGDDPFNPYE